MEVKKKNSSQRPSFLFLGITTPLLKPIKSRLTTFDVGEGKVQTRSREKYVIFQSDLNRCYFVKTLLLNIKYNYKNSISGFSPLQSSILQ